MSLGHRRRGIEIGKFRQAGSRTLLQTLCLSVYRFNHLLNPTMLLTSVIHGGNYTSLRLISNPLAKARDIVLDFTKVKSEDKYFKRRKSRFSDYLDIP